MYNPKDISVIIIDDKGKQQIVYGSEATIFTSPAALSVSEESFVAQGMMDKLNEALLVFPFKIPHTLHTEVAVEEILRQAYVEKMGRFATIPRVHYNRCTKQFGITMVSAKEELK